ncbi:MAG: hypothetical protein ACI9QQ_002526, partial [Myxococcota bacterium]
MSLFSSARPKARGLTEYRIVGRRIIICDGADHARQWARIGTLEHEELTWVPREAESSLRPPGFRALQGGLCVEAIAKLNPQPGEEIALVCDDGPWARAAIPIVAEAAAASPVLLLTDALTTDDVPDHRCLRLSGLKTLIRDDINHEFDHLANL